MEGEFNRINTNTWDVFRGGGLAIEFVILWVLDVILLSEQLIMVVAKMIIGQQQRSFTSFLSKGAFKGLFK